MRLDQLVSRKPVANLEGRCLRRVGAVNRVLLERAGKLFADRSLVCIGRVGGAHQLAQIGDGYNDPEAILLNDDNYLITRSNKINSNNSVKVLDPLAGLFHYLHWKPYTWLKISNSELNEDCLSTYHQITDNSDLITIAPIESIIFLYLYNNSLTLIAANSKEVSSFSDLDNKLNYSDSFYMLLLTAII